MLTIIAFVGLSSQLVRVPFSLGMLRLASLLFGEDVLMRSFAFDAV
jgi:hypothetical protein